MFCGSQESQKAAQGHVGVTGEFAGGHCSWSSAHFKQSTLHLLFCSLFETQGLGRLLEHHPEEKNVDVACFLGFDLIFEGSRKEQNNV